MTELFRITQTIEVEVTDEAELVAHVRALREMCDEERLRAVGALGWLVGRALSKVPGIRYREGHVRAHRVEPSGG
jgi:hypothetical protein